MIISHLTKVLVLAVLTSTSVFLYGQSVNITLKSQTYKDKTDYSSQLSKNLKDYEIVNIDLTDNIVSKLQRTDNATVQLELGDKTIVYDKFDLHTSDYNGEKKSVITLSSQNNENLTINKDFINGIYRDGKDVYAIQPLRDFVKGVDKNLFIIYRAVDIIDTEDHTCTINEVRSKGKSINRKMTASPCERIRLAIANDFSMFQKKGSITAVINHNTAVINSIRSLYRSDLSSVLEFEIVDFFIPTTSAQDPFISSTDVTAFLNDFKVWAQAGGNPWSNLAFDIGELWTDRDLTSGGQNGVAGFADTPLNHLNLGYLQVFHVLEDYTPQAISLQNLTAHEIGHNFGATHDAMGSSFIMAPSVVPSSVGWSTASIDSINLKLFEIGDDLLNCSCGEVITGPSLLCNGDTDNISLTISEGVGPYTLIYNDGVTQFTINNYVSGALISITPLATTTYTIETIEDVGANGLNYICGSNMSLIVHVFDPAGVASASGQQNSHVIDDCDVSTSVPLTTDISMLGADKVIGWWITEDQSITTTLSNANLASSLGGAYQGIPLSNPVNHIYESISGSPIKNFTLDVDCSALDDSKTYHATPFVSNKRVGIADTVCSINGAVFSGNFNGYPGRIALFTANDICRPQNPINEPVFTYSFSLSGFSGDTDSLFFFIYSPEPEGWFPLIGNGIQVVDHTLFNALDDPGLEDVQIWVWEEGGNGMANATLSIKLDITYPGAPAVVFPDVTDVNFCTFGTPVSLTCDCTLPPCNSTASVINTTNVNTGTIITTANQLSTSGITDVTTGTSIWQAQLEIILNEDFSVGSGSTLCIDIGPCEEN